MQERFFTVRTRFDGDATTVCQPEEVTDFERDVTFCTLQFPQKTDRHRGSNYGNKQCNHADLHPYHEAAPQELALGNMLSVNHIMYSG